jgi:hypothetical protein
MASFKDILFTGNPADNKNLDIIVNDLYVSGNLVLPSSGVTVVNANLFDSFNLNPIGTTQIYYYKIGRSVTISVQAFSTTQPLADNSSHIIVDFIPPSTIQPINNIAGGSNQMFGYMAYTYPLALTQGVGKIAIGDVQGGKLVLYGESTVGGFNTPTTVSIFNSNISYISSN